MQFSSIRKLNNTIQFSNRLYGEFEIATTIRGETIYHSLLYSKTDFYVNT